jgi:hypothetical protein
VVVLAGHNRLEDAIVSSSGTCTPGEPVKTSATSKGCDRKRWIFRARATVSLSSSRQLVHAEDRDDVLQRLVALQDPLHVAGHLVVLFADDRRVEDARGRVERVHGRVDAELGDRARQNGRGVEVGEGRGRRRVGQVVRGHVDGLHRGDRALLGRGDALLHRAHVGGQRRLVAHRRGDAAQQRRHLGARLREAEDVVDEEQHVGAGLVAELLGQRQAGQRDAGARAPGGSFIWP